jgi:tRNA A-37 threonylcarbamoyl transferase component Bud32
MIKPTHSHRDMQGLKPVVIKKSLGPSHNHEIFNEAIILKRLGRCYKIPAFVDHMGLAINIQAFLPGETAQKHIERRKYPVEYFGGFWNKIERAITTLHNTHGIIHRDLLMVNIMVPALEDGLTFPAEDIVLFDFGKSEIGVTTRFTEQCIWDIIISLRNFYQYILEKYVREYTISDSKETQLLKFLMDTLDSKAREVYSMLEVLYDNTDKAHISHTSVNQHSTVAFKEGLRRLLDDTIIVQKAERLSKLIASNVRMSTGSLSKLRTDVRELRCSYEDFHSIIENLWKAMLLKIETDHSEWRIQAEANEIKLDIGRMTFRFADESVPIEVINQLSPQFCDWLILYDTTLRLMPIYLEILRICKFDQLLEENLD